MTQQLQYALYGLFDLAYHGDVGPIPLREIGARQEIPTRYLEQIFMRLRRAGLVESKRGPAGGYVLARPADQISLADVVRAVEGSLLATPEDASGALASDARPAFVWERVRVGLESVLGARTLADLCREAARRGMRAGGERDAMYHI